MRSYFNGNITPLNTLDNHSILSIYFVRTRNDVKYDSIS